MNHGLENSAPRLAEQPQAGLRPETVQTLQNMVTTTAITDCPVVLTPAEARHILDLAITPWIVPSSWVQALVSGLRYTIIAARQARRSGFDDYAEWLERTRAEPIAEILRGLRPERWGERAPALQSSAGAA